MKAYCRALDVIFELYLFNFRIHFRIILDFTEPVLKKIKDMENGFHNICIPYIKIDFRHTSLKVGDCF